MKIHIKSILFSSLILFTITSFTQENESLESLFKVDYDTPLTLDLDAEEEEKIGPVKRKKKKKRNVYFGIKTRKVYSHSVIRNNIIIETFNVLKEVENPPEYAIHFYWFNYKKKKIINSRRIDKRNASVLHGPYKKMHGDQVIEEGWYYKGLKHRRWLRFNRFDILQDKTYWWKGWPQESRLVYYDFKKTKLREAIPVHYGERNGEYWAFHESGSIAVRGDYKFDHRVELWKEYYDGGRVKREVVYSNDPFDFKFDPYISKEWDSKGTVIYDKKKFLKSQN